MKRLFMVMMQGLVCVFVMMFIGACVATDDEAEDFLPVDHAAPPPVYHLPFMSGEQYTATTYPFHIAWDFNTAGDCGQPVIAASSGTVTSVMNGCPDYGYDASGNCTSCTCGGRYGNHVRINNGDTYSAIYAHMQTGVFVRSGQWVERGQVLGKLMSSGDSTGCHLHFEVRNSTGTPIWPDFTCTYGTGGLTADLVYTSTNQGKFDSMRNSLGIGNVGNQTTTNATRVHALGFSLTYNGGAFGENTMYYEALGCLGGAGCTRYNNTNYAWDVRGAIRAKYFSMGGPNSWLGFPTGNEYAWSNGQRQNFRCGYLYWNRGTDITTATSYGCP